MGTTAALSVAGKVLAGARQENTTEHPDIVLSFFVMCHATLRVTFCHPKMKSWIKFLLCLFEPKVKAVIFFWNTASTSFLIFSTSGRDDCRASFALTASLSMLYCEKSVMINWNSPSDIWLSAKALESSLSTVSHFVIASVTISWCFFIFESSFLLVIISPEEARANAPPTPPSGIVAGRPTTETAEPKLVLENAAERTLEPAALQLTTFLAQPFSKPLDSGQRLCS